MNLASNLTASASRSPGRAALKMGEIVVTYADLDQSSARLAGLWRRTGVRPGARVAIMLPNVPAFAVCYYGILRAGAIAVPMNVLLKEREIGFYLGASRAPLVPGGHEAG